MVERDVLLLDARDAGRSGLRSRSHGVSIISHCTLIVAEPVDANQCQLDERPGYGWRPHYCHRRPPNVGKSTLFNRIVGSRRAIVGDEPGITRDRLYGEAHFRGHRLRIVDTGGIEPDDKDLIPAEIFRQAKVALAEADAIILVVDGRSELTAPDLDLARLLLRGGKPLFLAVNKIDSDKQQTLIDEFHRLGIRKIFPVSAEHGRVWMKCLKQSLKL